MTAVTGERGARVCLLLEIPAVLMAGSFLLEQRYEQATLVGQLLDTALTVTSLALIGLFIASVIGHSRGKSIWTPLGLLVVVAAIFVFTILLALASSRVPPPEVIIIGLTAGVGSIAAVYLLTKCWPQGRAVPLPEVRKVGVTILVGFVSIAGVEAWNTLEFTPSRQEPSLTASADLSATTSAIMGTRVSGTVIVKNNGDVPALMVASQYVLWSLDVADVGDWPLEGTDPMAPDELADNGAGRRTVIGTGIPFRPYERIGPKSEAQFRFSLLTKNAGPAFRITVRLFSARGDRLFVEDPLLVRPDPFHSQDERGSQLVKTVREGSRLRALVRRPVVAVSTWSHEFRDENNLGAPAVNVAFFDKEDRSGMRSEVNEKALREYALARLFPEVTVLAEPEEGEASSSGSPEE